MLHMDAGYLAAYAIFNSIRKKKRDNIAGGKFGPSLRPTELDCYSWCSGKSRWFSVVHVKNAEAMMFKYT